MTHQPSEDPIENAAFMAFRETSPELFRGTASDDELAERLREAHRRGWAALDQTIRLAILASAGKDE